MRTWSQKRREEVDAGRARKSAKSRGRADGAAHAV